MGLFDKGVSPEEKQEIIDAAVEKLLEGHEEHKQEIIDAVATQLLGTFDAAKQEVISSVATELLGNEALLTSVLKQVMMEDSVVQNVKTRAQKEAEEPWVEIKGMVHDPANGLKIDLDWNAGFILYLKRGGYNGTNDDEIVQRWLAYMFKDVHDQMDQDEDHFS